MPFNGFKMSFIIDFNHPAFTPQTSNLSVDFSEVSFIREISRARTFGFIHELEHLRAQGLAQGGSEDNAIILDNYQVINKGGLRY